MLERQEKAALAVLVCVVGIVLAAHLLFDAVGRPLVADPYSPEVPDGALVLLEGEIEEIRTTSTGAHLLLTVNGTPVVLPQNVVAGLELLAAAFVAVLGAALFTGLWIGGMGS